MKVVYFALPVQLFKHENSTWWHSKSLNHTSLPIGKVLWSVNIYLLANFSAHTPGMSLLTKILTSLKLGGTNLLHLNLSTLLKFWQNDTDEKWIAHKILYRAVPWEIVGTKINFLPSERKQGKKNAWRFVFFWWGEKFAVVRICLVGCLLLLFWEYKWTEDLNYMAFCLYQFPQHVSTLNTKDQSYRAPKCSLVHSSTTLLPRENMPTGI